MGSTCATDLAYYYYSVPLIMGLNLHPRRPMWASLRVVRTGRAYDLCEQPRDRIAREYCWLLVRSLALRPQHAPSRSEQRTRPTFCPAPRHATAAAAARAQRSAAGSLQRRRGGGGDHRIRLQAGGREEGVSEVSSARSKHTEMDRISMESKLDIIFYYILT